MYIVDMGRDRLKRSGAGEEWREEGSVKELMVPAVLVFLGAVACRSLDMVGYMKLERNSRDKGLRKCSKYISSYSVEKTILMLILVLTISSRGV
jgi:hypothetical protein